MLGKSIQEKVFSYIPDWNEDKMKLRGLFREKTPIERHVIQCPTTKEYHEVFVKREDLFGIPPAPPLAKLRGARAILLNLYLSGIETVGCWDTRVSRLGHGIAAIAQRLGMRCICAYPKLKNQKEHPEAMIEAEKLGAEIYPTKAGRINITMAEARRYIQSQGGYFLPFGLQCDEAVLGVQEEAKRTYHEEEIVRKCRSLLLSTGSGVTLAGIIRGFESLPESIISISAGKSIKSILRYLRKYLIRIPDELILRSPLCKYDIKEERSAPFPCHPNYDRKVWHWMIENIENLPKPILFWNIGG